ncbi:Zinc ABC transporter, ATP-binding protein ZnuC [Bathymodiolus thermophilus thioautotrophic gill symbiont]|uniref:Zinc ABC transporter ATP-binding protein ZnuC n=1 Tax=Bathymodiolus thermophilus thioautotrophic gill symbiont TaxID=2360 RepID=A0A1J5UL67_9GAMM|nr:ATP-binding cassette domain-containing protein [Bathymodiolus thermophilus thioautotrophic gill symbiont]AYQ57725.1 Zinc import ATP-binding protein ZnuC [Bathymodiolus thermophilus thioautotrophic gill symbiont]OIR24999.1 zinc ABC transporter ATP-binding protein ZnuC [Bathymodiolus thermophilus thioautotrophic gill symbiont]CAB5496757.1 Zinc ABC transporter, ATP-binding protein ZnuC [Bathymodiolus thermophilus thioautotrophic gill symbiont]CAB5505521.1 Zinc ABC transporter, ATP-binding prote
MSKTLISANHISLSHHGKKVLDDVSFELKAGEFITLIGPNGAGKSSLIKILLGLIASDHGKIKKSKDIRLGYTPQKFIANEFIPIIVADFLKLNQKIDTQFLTDIATLTGIETRLNLPLSSLSGGEMQRVLLARALLAKPNVLILDEPAQNLDIDGQMQLYKLIQDIHQQQDCAVLMVSHDLHRVMKESTQVLCLYRHICCMGQPETLIKNRQFNDLFADQMDELMATYEHHHNHCHKD